MGAVGSAAMVLPGPVIAPEAAARQGMFAPHGSVWSAATWLFLLPVACAMASRHAYRTFVGSVTRRKWSSETERGSGDEGTLRLDAPPGKASPRRGGRSVASSGWTSRTIARVEKVNAHVVHTRWTPSDDTFAHYSGGTFAHSSGGTFAHSSGGTFAHYSGGTFAHSSGGTFAHSSFAAVSFVSPFRARRLFPLHLLVPHRRPLRPPLHIVPRLPPPRDTDEIAEVFGGDDREEGHRRRRSGDDDSRERRLSLTHVITSSTTSRATSSPRPSPARRHLSGAVRCSRNLGLRCPL